MLWEREQAVKTSVGKPSSVRHIAARIEKSAPPAMTVPRGAPARRRCDRHAWQHAWSAWAPYAPSTCRTTRSSGGHFPEHTSARYAELSALSWVGSTLGFHYVARTESPACSAQSSARLRSMWLGCSVSVGTSGLRCFAGG